MTIYSAFSIPTLGMMGQSHALATIGNNIANVTTGGFKRTDTNFSTLLSQTIDKQSDIGGVKPQDLNQITQLGNMVISNRDLDLAINGQGFFVLNSDIGGGGQTYYGRDGSFEMATVNDITVTGNGGSTITTKDGYLVDKNGYYVQGWTADPVTGLFTNTSLSALRIDPYAFAQVGQQTTSAALKLNLPATDEPGQVQVTEVALSGTIEAGDVYDVTVDGTSVSYTATGAEANFNVIRDALVSSLNANTTIAAVAVAEASPTDSKLLVKGLTQGTAVTIASSSTNAPAGINDSSALSSIVQTAKAGDTEYYNIEVFDSNGAARSTRLDFAKLSNNTWNLSSTVGRTPVAQVDTISLAGTAEAGDVYSVTLEGNLFSHTVTATDTLSTIRDGLVSSINLNTTIQVTAAASGANDLTLTANTAGESFTASATATNRSATAQVDNITLSGVYAAGDIISVNVNGIGAVTYTVHQNDLSGDGSGGGGVVAGDSATAYNNISTNLAGAIAGDAPTAAVVTAAASGGGTGVVTLTGASSGTAFTQVTSASMLSGTSTASTATANVAAVAQVDNVTLSGDFQIGDSVTINVGAGNVTYNVIGADLTDNGADGTGTDAISKNNIAIKLAAAVAGDGPSTAIAAATAPGSGVVALTSATAGTAFTTTPSEVTAGTGALGATTPTANVVAVAQVDNATLTGTYGAGDTVTVNVNGLGAVTYTVVANDLTANGAGGGGTVAGNSAAAYNNITTKIAAAVNANAPSAAVITAAAPGGGGGVVSITADSAGTAFSHVTSATNGGTAAIAATTPTTGVVATNDNVATRANTVANVSTSDTTTTSVTSLTFNEDGSLATPTTGSVTLTLTFPAVGTVAAGTATVTLDVSELTQFAGNFQPFSFNGNGYAAANAESIKFDTSGQIIATFDDASHRAVYKIPLAQFANANALQEYNGNVYQETAESGNARVVDVDKTGYASFLPNTHELSNVDLADEFTRMMMTQTAYNSSSTVFKTVDEMVTTARDLKR